MRQILREANTGAVASNISKISRALTFRLAPIASRRESSHLKKKNILEATIQMTQTLVWLPVVGLVAAKSRPTSIVLNTLKASIKLLQIRFRAQTKEMQKSFPEFTGLSTFKEVMQICRPQLLLNQRLRMNPIK